MTLNELSIIRHEGGWGWVFDPENIKDGYECAVSECILPTIFEGYPEGFDHWYSICAIHGWFLGMTACFDED